MNDKTFANQFHVPNTKTTLISRFANVIPRAVSYRTNMMILLNSGPPKFSNDGGNLFNESFGEKNSRHVVYRNGSKHEFNILQSTSMIKFVSL
jgi:hypothetical protein